MIEEQKWDIGGPKTLEEKLLPDLLDREEIEEKIKKLIVAVLSLSPVEILSLKTDKEKKQVEVVIKTEKKLSKENIKRIEEIAMELTGHEVRLKEPFLWKLLKPLEKYIGMKKMEDYLSKKQIKNPNRFI